MNNIGLSQYQLNILQQLFEKYSAIEQVKLYGSRAKGNYNERSDIDLALFGKSIQHDTLSQLLIDLDDCDIPYQIDLQNYAELQNPQLIEHINRVGVTIYNKHEPLCFTTKKP